MRVLIQSFGHKHGAPPEADLVLDARVLPNPYGAGALRNLTGKDRAVALWLEEREATAPYIETAYGLMYQGIGASNGSSIYTVAIGCMGGNHRSVYVAEQLGAIATLDGQMRRHSITVEHRDLCT